MVPSLDLFLCLCSPVALMGMGNGVGKEDGEGTSGAKKNGYEVDNELSNSDPMLHSPPHCPNEAYQLPFLFPPQIPEAPSPRPGQMMQVQNPLVENTTYYEDLHQEEKRAVMITWCFGGKQVAITGSWDNGKTIESLHSLGEDFIIMKMLPSGVYHYFFIVDELRRYAPNLPWEFDESGRAYNILDLQEFVPDASERLSEFESSPSSISSYDNHLLNDDDFTKPPPELPPQLPTKSLDERPVVTRSQKSSQRPSHTLLNHVYKQDADDGQSMALCLTHRFLVKYVTVILYKSLQR